jgi:hypothetical protein
LPVRLGAPEWPGRALATATDSTAAPIRDPPATQVVVRDSISRPAVRRSSLFTLSSICTGLKSPVSAR